MSPEISPPRLSVVIVVRNGADTIARALDSLATQYYPNLELVIWDGLSEDGTLDILKQYSHLITLLKSEKDSGPPDAYNKAVALCSGDFIGFLNADDEYEPGALWAVADKIFKYPESEVVSFGMLYYRAHAGNYSSIKGYYADERQLALTLDHILLENQTFMLSRFYRRALLAEAGPFNTDRSLWYYSNDREFMARLAVRGCKNTIIPKALYGFAIHEESLSNNPVNYSSIVEEHTRIAAMLLARKELNTHQRTAIINWRKRQLVFGFWQALASRKFYTAQLFIKRGLTLASWQFIPLSFYLLARKMLKRIGLALSGGIDRGTIL